MYRVLFRNTITLCGAVVIPQGSDSISDSLQPEEASIKWNRVKKIFFVSEFGELSPQLNTMIQTTLFTGFFGCFYGGFLGSKEAYLKFVERNEATKFSDHFEAKKKLQHSVTLGFGQGALRWGWRLALFSGFYVSFVTIFAAYRGSSSLLDYTIAGLFSGIIYRIHMGTRAMVASGTLGCMMGLFAGALSNLLFHLTNTSLDDVHNYTYEMSTIRDKHFKEAAKKTEKEDPQGILQAHDQLATKD